MGSHSLPPSPISPSFPPSLPPSLPQFYRKPLLARTTTSQVILSERDINTIFYRTEDLAEVHTVLHEKLEPQLRDWTVNTCVGDFFVELVRGRGRKGGRGEGGRGERERGRVEKSGKLACKELQKPGYYRYVHVCSLSRLSVESIIVR